MSDPHAMIDAVFESSFLKQLEEHHDVVLPKYLQHLLIVMGFDNSETFGEINDEAINEMEIFGKSSLQDYMKTIVAVIPTDRLKDIYHIYGNDPEKFKIVLGHKLMLKKISARYAKATTDSSAAVSRSSMDGGPAGKRPKLGARMQEHKPEQMSGVTTAPLSVEAAVSAIPEQDLINMVNSALVNAGIDTVAHVESIDMTNAMVECNVCKKLIRLQVQNRLDVSRVSASNFVRHIKTHIKPDEANIFGRKVKQSLLPFIKLNTNSPTQPIKTEADNNQIAMINAYPANTTAGLGDSGSCDYVIDNGVPDSPAIVNATQAYAMVGGIVDVVNAGASTSGINNHLIIDQIITVPSRAQLKAERTDGDVSQATAELAAEGIVYRSMEGPPSSSMSNDRKQLHMALMDANKQSKPYEDGLLKASNKWKDPKYSVRERHKRKLLYTIDLSQPKIDTVFKVVHKLDAIANENQVVATEVTKVASSLMVHDASATIAPFECNKTFFMDMYRCFMRNEPLAKNGKRYSSDVKRFSAYMFVIGGRLLYETISSNLPLPSISTVLRVLHSDFPPITEGQLRVKELKAYLLSKNAPMAVWLSEDGTRITSKVQYDGRSNKLVGLVMPLDNQTGFPKGTTFTVDSAKGIADHFMSGKPSNYAYVIMAQAVVDNMSPFCLSIFGTDNSFKAQDVLNRWKTMQTDLAAEGIEVMGFSSDGDSRLLKAMRTQMIPASEESNDDLPPLWCEWFCTKYLPANICVQDTVHIGTKLRTRLLNAKDLVVMGDFVASVNHLAILLESKTKDIHQLKSSDLNGADKMNFGAVQSISHERMETILTDVPGSEGTLVYLRIIRYVLKSFMDEKIDATDRIYKMWYAVFVLRLWKAWLITNTNYRAENFITSNAYTCIELNAHALINCVVKARDMSKDWSKVWLFNSQTCESFFRKARSQTSTYCTVVNFSMLDFLHRAKRIQAQEDISRELNTKYVFTRQTNRNVEIPINVLPSNELIHNTIVKARRDAINTIHDLGISTLIVHNKIPMIVHHTQTSTQTYTTTHEADGGEQEINPEPEINSDVSEDMVPSEDDGMHFDLFLLQQFNDFQCLTQLENVSSKLATQCLQFQNRAGKTFFVKKSTLCWLLNNANKQTISSDRIRRFIVQKSTNIVQTTANDKGQLKIGDWAEFKNNNNVGQVIGFTYLTGSRKEREYTLDSVPINESTGSSRGIGVLCNWFLVRPGFVLESAPVEKHEYVNITQFKAHLFKPKIDNVTMQLLLDERNTFSSEE